MNRTWRSQKIYNEENKRRSVAELWWEAFNRVDKMSFHSSTSETHQLEPFNYSLSIPPISNLDSYDKSKAISALLGKGTKTNLKEKDDLATIYHELFHVFQTNSTRKTLDYFYLVDDVQRKRTELLEYLGYANFFTLAESTNSDFGKSIFHCVENYEKLGNKENFSSMFDEVLKERYIEIDEDIEKFIIQYGENYREQFTEQAQSTKKSFQETIEKQIEDNVALIQDQAKDIKKYSDLSRHPIEELIEFFKLQKDTNLHLFHLIEGSAQIFGWCCAGYDIDEKFAFRKKELEESESPQTNTYERTYELFKEHGGKTPLLFIIISLFSLSVSKPIDVYIESLRNIKIWEKDLESLLEGKEITSNTFNSITLRLMEQIETSLKGNFFNINIDSVHDKEAENSIFLKSIHRIREIIPQSNKLEFLTDLILKEDVVLALIESFESHIEEFKDDLRKNEVMRDFEKFLRDNGTDFDLNCCSIHGKLDKDNEEEIWYSCSKVDSFISVLLNNFKIAIPEKLI